MAKSGYRQAETTDEKRGERTVQSVSISRRAASRSTRVNSGGKRSVSRGRRRDSSRPSLSSKSPTGCAQPAWPSLRPHGTSWRPAKLAGLVARRWRLSPCSASRSSSDAWFVYAEDVQVRNLSYLRRRRSSFGRAVLKAGTAFGLRPARCKERVQATHTWNRPMWTFACRPQVVIDVQGASADRTLGHQRRHLLAHVQTASPCRPLRRRKVCRNSSIHWARPDHHRRRYTLAVDPDVLASALALMDRLPGLNDQIRYQPQFRSQFSFAGSRRLGILGRRSRHQRQAGQLEGRRSASVRTGRAGHIDRRALQAPTISSARAAQGNTARGDIRARNHLSHRHRNNQSLRAHRGRHAGQPWQSRAADHRPGTGRQQRHSPRHDCQRQRSAEHASARPSRNANRTPAITS